MLSRSVSCVLSLEPSVCVLFQSRNLGRRVPNQGKPPILPPAKKVLYHVVHVPWQSPDDVKELLWRRHVYNNAVMSLKEVKLLWFLCTLVFQQELQQSANAGKGLESMKEEEDAEFNRLIAENDRINNEKVLEVASLPLTRLVLQAQLRAKKDEEEWKSTQLEILTEVEEALQKQHNLAKEATVEANLWISLLVFHVVANSLKFQVYDPLPVKYQEGVPTRQKGRLFDRTLGLSPNSQAEEDVAQGKLTKAEGV
ncbi:unnamed protein product [Nippostrongylus brasiliensis]|uniref:Transmembrane protein n=1 Tax=Nippostrongylus brasiliensis TaxID=27835 RepID=A0A0N4YLX0_NIPBR|nr:unnamed protein product [Nippostrongylus brasiliensis]